MGNAKHTQGNIDVILKWEFVNKKKVNSTAIFHFGCVRELKRSKSSKPFDNVGIFDEKNKMPKWKKSKN